MAKRRRGSISIASRLVLALAIPSLYCLLTSFAGYATHAVKAGAFLSPIGGADNNDDFSAAAAAAAFDAPVLRKSKSHKKWIFAAPRAAPKFRKNSFTAGKNKELD